MPGWWAKLKSGLSLDGDERPLKSLAENQVGLSSELVGLLLGDFKNLTGGEQNVAERLTRYAVTGEDEAAVAELPARVSQLKTVSYYTFLYPAHSRFLAQVQATDAPFFYRLARIYFEIAACKGFATRGKPRIALGLGDDLYPFLQALGAARPNARGGFPVSVLEEVFKLAGQDADTIARTTYLADPNNYWETTYSTELSSFGGFGDYSVRHRHVVVEALTHARSEQRLHALGLLRERGVPPAPFRDTLVGLACSSSKLARAAAAALLEGCRTEAASLLEKRAVEGSAEERLHAVKLLHELVGEDYAAFLNSRLEVEKAPKVRELIGKLLSPSVAAESPTEPEDELPTLPPVVVEPEAPLSAEFLKELRRALDEFAEGARLYYEKHKANNKWLHAPVAITPETVEQIFSLLQTGDAEACQRHSSKPNYMGTAASRLTARLFAHPEFKLIHAARWVCLTTTGQLVWHLIWNLSGHVQHLDRHGAQPLNLRTLAAVMRALKLNEGELLNFVFNRYYSSQPVRVFMSRDEDVWPYLAENMPALKHALRGDADPGERAVALTLLRSFPRVPGGLSGRVWDIALGSSKTERPLAQSCLEEEPRRFERIVLSLGDRSAEARAVAADWLGRLGDARAVEHLRKAFEKEKSESVRDALLRALEKLGASIDEYFDRARLEEEARAGLRRAGGSPPAWLAFDLMPAVAWADTGEPVGVDVLKWFVVQSVRQKQVEPSPMLRRYCSTFERAGRERLGQFVLESWVAQDTLGHTPEEAEPLARAQAAQMIRYYAQSGKTQEQLYREALNALLRVCKGSAINEKGVLALAAACCGAAAVPVVGRYLKEWHGERAAQSKALVRLLAEIDDLSATQTLLSVANRFRTRGIQDEAAKHVELLAERKGWTLDELADRTVPTLGFEPNGELRLDYGERHFAASLDAKFNFVLADETGKRIKSLPGARKGEDESQVKEAKKLFADAKKGLKQLLALQRDRLYEAMCTQREWSFREWDAFLNRHPVVGRYCQSLVWVVWDGDRAGASFRPLSDGTLTDAQDEQVTLEGDARLRLAHSRTVSKEQAAAWLAHFGDYEVTPLFEQFGREEYVLADEMRRETDVKDFEGHLVETFKLRGRATALGYTRGQSEDAGWFYIYKKTFLGLRLEAFIEFTGNGLPEENRVVALKSLSFSPLGGQTSGYRSSGQSLALGKIPPVLLSEVWNDMRSIAAQGTGYDPDWEKKSEY